MSGRTSEASPLMANELINVVGNTRRTLRRKRIKLACFILSFLLLLIASLGLMIISFPMEGIVSTKVEEIIKNEVVLQDGSFSLPIWTDPPVKMYKDFFIFNWTNPDNVINGSQKPNFKILGPYKYREYRTKYIDNKHSNKCVISYIQHKTYEFDPEASFPLMKNDKVFVLNIPVAAAPQQISNTIERIALEGAIKATGAKLYKEIEVDDLIWGYTDTFIELLQTVGKFPKGVKFQIQKNDDPRDYNSLSSVGTGRCNISDLGNFHQWDGFTSLDIWNDSEHNKVKGTEGLLNQPLLKEGQELFIWIDDIMRWAVIYDTGERHTRKGLLTWRFTNTKEFFYNETRYPPNRGWYQNAPEGLLYIGNSTIPAGNPVWGSNPLFYQGDPGLVQNVSGVTPDPSKYTYADIEPLTGAVVYVHRQIQINFELRRADYLFYKHLPEVTYFPVMYVDEHGELSQELYDTISQKLLLAQIGYGAHWVLLVIGILLLIPTVIIGFCILKHIQVIKAIKVYRDITSP
ncbi:Lysosome membrane protein 2-like [Oopsacas minuta]|uniref:Lysosome membrane protein 2-like n=1 Tax=Oopsacas minuta TaxID=111878 RepID=A0AAV7JE09_9METZ|nr:Lysosome membrane protein 2-like [Oopsacas minuta]